MKREKLAAIGLALIIIGALSVYLVVEYKDEIIESLTGEQDEEKANGIAFGDCVDVHYISRYASNGTVIASSYDDIENKIGGTPLNVFVTSNTTESPPDDYMSYFSDPLDAGMNYMSYALSPIGIKEGFIDSLIGLEEGDKETTGFIPPEKAYGVLLKYGDIVNFSLVGIPLEFKVLDIQKNATITEELKDFYPDLETMDLCTLRQESYYIGEVIDKYSSWINSTVVTKINDTTLWTYVTPTTELNENFTWVYFDSETLIQTTYPTNSSSISSINDATIVVTHSPELNSTIETADYYAEYGMFAPAESYTVENINDDKINASLTDSEGNKTYYEFNRTVTIQRNETQNITQAIPWDSLESLLLALRFMDDDFTLCLNDLAGETVYFEIEIVKVYKGCSES